MGAGRLGDGLAVQPMTDEMKYEFDLQGYLARPPVYTRRLWRYTMHSEFSVPLHPKRLALSIHAP